MPQIAAKLLEGVPGLSILHQADRVMRRRLMLPTLRAALMPVVGRFMPFSTTCHGALPRLTWFIAERASTVAELGAAGKPALLVPFPQAPMTTSAAMLT